MIQLTQQVPRPTAQLELTPLIDIVFIVVVFLLLTANSQLLSLAIEVPDTDSPLNKASNPAKPLTLTLTQQPPYWAIDQQRYEDWSEFRAAFAQQVLIGSTEVPVNVAADATIPAQRLLQVLALLNEYQMTNSQLLMEKP